MQLERRLVIIRCEYEIVLEFLVCFEVLIRVDETVKDCLLLIISSLGINIVITEDTLWSNFSFLKHLWRRLNINIWDCIISGDKLGEAFAFIKTVLIVLDKLNARCCFVLLILLHLLIGIVVLHWSLDHLELFTFGVVDHVHVEGFAFSLQAFLLGLLLRVIHHSVTVELFIFKVVERLIVSVLIVELRLGLSANSNRL